MNKHQLVSLKKYAPAALVAAAVLVITVLVHTSILASVMTPWRRMHPSAGSSSSVTSSVSSVRRVQETKPKVVEPAAPEMPSRPTLKHNRPTK
jgi:hypothetical protein